MDMEQIKTAIEHPDYGETSDSFHEILKDRYETWRNNELKLEDISASQTELRKLEQKNAELEKAIAEKEAGLKQSQASADQAQKQITEGMAATAAEIRSLDEQIAALDNDCHSLQGQIDKLVEKKTKMEELQRKLEECKSEKRDLQTQIEGSSEEEKSNRALVDRLSPCVEKLERHEKEMSDLMISIWGDLEKKDSFDKMF